ncbi:MAG: dihydropteroate synthase [Myxococcota bacterium]|jgi:dihydropteroate synthase
MGVLNCTPDSFSDGGLYSTVSQAIERGVALVAAGASMLDVGGESTRPGAAPVSASVQLDRVLPVIKGLVARLDVPISIDTTIARVAEQALGSGARIVNDISAFRFDVAMLPLLAERGCPAIAMHTLDRSAVMQNAPRYEDVVATVIDHLRHRLAACSDAGVDPSQVVIDPGIGFGKTLAHNLQLIQATPRLAALGQAVLVGTSNKGFLGQLTGKPVGQRLMGTAASSAVAIALGAHIVRVHDVAGVMDAVTVADAIARV